MSSPYEFVISTPRLLGLNLEIGDRRYNKNSNFARFLHFSTKNRLFFAYVIKKQYLCTRKGLNVNKIT